MSNTVKAQTYQVQGMDCTGCAANIEKGINRLEGVRNARVDFATSQLHVEGDVPFAVVQQRVETLGYMLSPTITPPASAARGGIAGFWAYLLVRDETRLAVIGGVLLILSAIVLLLGLPENLANIGFVIATAVAGYPIARSGLNTLWINRDFNINLLMTIAAVGAVVIGETPEAATVIFLFAIGEALEGYTAERARESIRSLMELAPAQALRVNGQSEAVVPVEQLRVDDLILIKPGERIPMDGVVVDGNSDVNQAPITGESLPVAKTQHDEVYAGTINGAGMLRVRVTRLAADNTLSRIIQLVQEAQSERAHSQRLIDQFARIYTPAVVVFAVLVAFVPPLLLSQPFWNLPDGSHGWLYRALSLLVIACPCALVISAPVTVISAITAAARRGVLIKGGTHLEALGKIRAIAFDKTGTLTRGDPLVMVNRSVDCVSGEPCALCDDVLALATAVEQRSTHPLAKAVLQAAQARGVDGVYAPAEQVELLAGRGVRGRVAEKWITVGSHRLFDAEYPHSEALCRQVQQAEAQGQTALLLADDSKVRGFISVADSVREDSRKVVGELKRDGMVIVMLTGDNAISAQAVGAQVGVDDVRAGLLPADKVTTVKELLEKYTAVAMIGDGVNDTPALAAATVGVAMGGVGSGQVLETADVVLMADDLSQLPFAIRLSRFTRRLIVQNVTLSLAVKLIFVLLALFWDTSLWLAIFADVGMSLLVTLNGMRPLRFEAR